MAAATDELGLGRWHAQTMALHHYFDVQRALAWWSTAKRVPNGLSDFALLATVFPKSFAPAPPTRLLLMQWRFGSNKSLYIATVWWRMGRWLHADPLASTW